MNSELQIFSSDVFGTIRIADIDGKTWFCGNDVAKALGYADATGAVTKQCRKDGWLIQPVIDSLGREQQARFINEGNLYRLIAHSQLPSAEKFEKWVFDEVLPSVRKHGLYATDELLNNPDLFISVLVELKTEREKRQNAELENAKSRQIISELRPKASYYDLILQSKSLVPISQIAKDYGMSGRRLNAILHDFGIQFKQGNTWLLYQKYAEQGYTHSKTIDLDAEKSVMHTYWTQKGRLFLYDLLKNEMGILPIMERDLSA